MRHILLGLAAVASAAAALWNPPEQAAVVLPVAPASAGAAAGLSRVRDGGATLASLAPRVASAEERSAVFGVPEWTRPVPVPKAVEAAPVVDASPQAPPAPFRVIGRWDEDGQAGVFLEHQQKALAVRVGDQLTPEWKVESIEGARLVLEYLPLAQKQILEWSAP